MCAWSCPTLCDTLDCSPRGSSVHGVSQARILEWVTISSSRRSDQDIEPASAALQADSLPLSHYLHTNHIISKLIKIQTKDMKEKWKHIYVIILPIGKGVGAIPAGCQT